MCWISQLSFWSTVMVVYYYRHDINMKKREGEHCLAGYDLSRQANLPDYNLYAKPEPPVSNTNTKNIFLEITQKHTQR